MEKFSDTTTTVFRIPIKENRPAVFSSYDRTTIWSDTFGLGWRFGIAYNPSGQSPKVRLYIDHNQTQTEQDQATVTVSLRDSTDKGAKELGERVTTITDFGHGQPALLGSWSPSDLALHPYVSFTVTTKARLPKRVSNPLSSTSLSLRRSLGSGDFVDTKFYVFSARRPGSTGVGKPRVVYCNDKSVGLLLPKSTSGTKQSNESAPKFLVNMTSDRHINDDSVLHEYDYEQDSDLDDDDSDDIHVASGWSVRPPRPTGSAQRGVHGGMEDASPAEPPAYSASTSRMILVKGVAYKTWLSYIDFRYTGQVSFRPLKSTQSSSRRRSNGPTTNQPPYCSPKSMYRLATKLGDERMKELAFRAIKEGLSKDNIVEEAFSWFTAQYPTISEYEVDRVSEFRKSPEVLSAFKVQLKSVSLGEKPWADGILVAIMEKLNPSGPSA